MDSNPATRPSLLLRLQNSRDQHAWAEFAAVYEPVIYRMTRRRGLQDADAREVVQEVLMSVAAAIDRFDVEATGSFRGWLARITRNEVVDLFRRLAAGEQVVGSGVMCPQLDRAAIARAEQEQSAAEEFDRQRREQLFRWAAGEVRKNAGESNWIAFWQTAVEARSVSEVAAELGISEGAVYVARCRILKRIRQRVRARLSE